MKLNVKACRGGQRIRLCSYPVERHDLNGKTRLPKRVHMRERQEAHIFLDYRIVSVGDGGTPTVQTGKGNTFLVTSDKAFWGRDGVEVHMTVMLKRRIKTNLPCRSYQHGCIKRAGLRRSRRIEGI